MKPHPPKLKDKRRVTTELSVNWSKIQQFTQCLRPLTLLFKISIVAGIVIGSGLSAWEILKQLTPKVEQNDAIAPSSPLPPPLLTPTPTLQPTSTPSPSPTPTVVSLPPPPQPRLIPTSQPIYNLQRSPQFTQSPHLQEIVDRVVDLVSQKGLPTQTLSIQLIDIKTNQKAGYQSQEFRFPASIAKLFWLVALYAWIEQGLLPPNAADYDLKTCQTDICKMVQKSDNNAASKILDLLTGTSSGQDLEGEAYTTWLARRQSINQFFQTAGYQDIEINQKNFPIPDLNLSSPKGSDLKMRGDPNFPLRNRITAEQAARLMYEIFDSQAVSRIASQKMMQLLTRYDLQTGAWKTVEYNPIEGFLGESLPPNTYFASKVGWTSDSRQEVAYIATQDGKTTYILAIFAEGVTYGEDWKIFPEISQLVFNEMTSH